MTNAKSLLKKAELFERLAIYGGRRAFLKSIAFDSEAFNAILEKTKGYLANAKRLIGGEAGSIPEPTDVDQIASQITRLNVLVNAMTDGLQKNQANSDLLTAKTFLKKTKELAPELPQEPEIESEDQGGEMIMPESQIKGKSYQSVPKDIQQALGLTGMQVDGILGPETRRRLNLQKLYYKLPATTPDSEVYKRIRGEQIKTETPF